MNIFKASLIAVLAIVLASCANPWSKKTEETESDVDKIVKKKKRSGPVNMRERALGAETGGIVFGGKDEDPFGKQNVMWRATLNTLEFMPIDNADYVGGVFTTDWYSEKNSNESIKITVKFNSQEVKVSSIDVNSFKKICDKTLSCKTLKMDKDFNSKIKRQILEEVKTLEIEKASKKK